MATAGVLQRASIGRRPVVPSSGPRGAVPAMTQPTALITGITGQDGSYLAELLLEKGYELVGQQELE